VEHFRAFFTGERLVFDLRSWWFNVWVTILAGPGSGWYWGNDCTVDLVNRLRVGCYVAISEGFNKVLDKPGGTGDTRLKNGRALNLNFIVCVVEVQGEAVNSSILMIFRSDDQCQLSADKIPARVVLSVGDLGTGDDPFAKDSGPVRGDLFKNWFYSSAIDTRATHRIHIEGIPDVINCLIFVTS
jgi:hypothetical protein